MSSLPSLWIESMPTPNDLELHAYLRDKFIAFRHAMKDHITMILIGKSALVPPKKCGESSSLSALAYAPFAQ
jgi:hypothetical protein